MVGEREPVRTWTGRQQSATWQRGGGPSEARTRSRALESLDLVRVQPDLALAAAQNGRGKALLNAQAHHPCFCSERMKEDRGRSEDGVSVRSVHRKGDGGISQMHRSRRIGFSENSTKQQTGPEAAATRKRKKRPVTMRGSRRRLRSHGAAVFSAFPSPSRGPATICS